MGKFVPNKIGVYTPDRLILPQLVALGGAVETSLKDSSINTCYGGVLFGTSVDFTAIGESGAMWYVRLAGLRPGLISGADTRRSKCVGAFTVTVGVGYITCYPIDDEGKPMTTDQQITLGSEVHAAMMTLWRAISCSTWNATTSGIGSVDVQQWSPLGPDGGALGGEWQVVFEVLNRRPEPTPEP